MPSRLTTSHLNPFRASRSPMDMSNTRAYGPRDLPLSAWVAAFWRLPAKIADDRMLLIAAGVAFYGLLSLFPAITALMAVAGLIFDPETVTAELQSVVLLMPDTAARIVMEQARDVAGTDQGGLGFAAIFGLSLAFWSASLGVGSLMQGINVAFERPETRSYLSQAVARLVLTIVLIFGVVTGFALIFVIPLVFKFIAPDGSTGLLIDAARWGAVMVLSSLGVLVLYRYAPVRHRARWRWLVPGAVMCTVLWVTGCLGFSIYVENFASYQQTFGTLAGVVVLLLWLWLSATVLLLGAELNAALDAVNRDVPKPDAD